jgi:hypothetical protein
MLPGKPGFGADPDSGKLDQGQMIDELNVE